MLVKYQGDAVTKLSSAPLQFAGSYIPSIFLDRAAIRSVSVVFATEKPSAEKENLGEHFFFDARLKLRNLHSSREHWLENEAPAGENWSKLHPRMKSFVWQYSSLNFR